jgi:hypothetical protein
MDENIGSPCDANPLLFPHKSHDETDLDKDIPLGDAEDPATASQIQEKPFPFDEFSIP